MLPLYFFISSQPARFQQIPIGTNVESLNIPRGIYGCYVQAEAQNVRWRADGTDPSTTVGMILYASGQPTWFSEGLSKLKFIGAASGAILNVEYK